jgi:hypothetical protein
MFKTTMAVREEISVIGRRSKAIFRVQDMKFKKENSKWH